MKLEFDILKRPLETELSYQDRAPSYLIGPVLALFTLGILPHSADDDFFALKLILGILIFVFIIKKLANKKPESIIIENEIIDKIIITDSPFSITTSKGESILDSPFKGDITIRYESYNKEVVGMGRTATVYYGTNNKLIINGHLSKKKYFIFLKGTFDRKKFQSLPRLFMENGIKVKEFTRGERTYDGKKLNYQQIQEWKKENIRETKN